MTLLRRPLACWLVTLVTLVTLGSSLGCSSSSGGTSPASDSGTADLGADVAVDTGSDAATDVPIDTGGSVCTSARDTALGPIDKVSSGAVTTLSDTGGVKTLFIDASAGGVDAAKNNPWVYVDLATGTRVDLTDKASYTAANWDLALKRPILHTNSGDGGPGGGGAAMLTSKAFDTITVADASSATFKTESWFDSDCVLQVDAIGSVKTSFDGWYAYDSATTKVTPKAGSVWLVRGSKGDFYKVELQSYYSNADGTDGTAGGRYKLRYAALK